MKSGEKWLKVGKSWGKVANSGEKWPKLEKVVKSGKNGEKW